MLPLRVVVAIFGLAAVLPRLHAQTEIGASHLTPNVSTNIDRPLRYRPDRGDFVIENGHEYFNRSLYGGNTAFRVDGGDKPEFVLYLPGRGGNLRFGLRTAAGAKWLQEAVHIEARYRPGELMYEIRDPLLGSNGIIRLTAIAYAVTEGLVVRIAADDVDAGAELVWAYGGANGQRGKRDGDIGTENVPISQWFQLKPEFCRGNVFGVCAAGFTLRSKAATIAGVVPAGASQAVVDGTNWNDIAALFRAPGAVAASTSERLRDPSADTPRHEVNPAFPVMTGRIALAAGKPLYLSLQRIPNAADGGNAGAVDLDVYREVGAAAGPAPKGSTGVPSLLAPFAADELPQRFADAEQHFSNLRNRVAVETPDEFINAAVGALNVAADAVWDESQHGIMHGAIAWRTRLLGWRGPYALDALGWHDRFQENAEYWMARQNTGAIPAHVPPPEEKFNLARNEAGLHTNGDMSNSHYDMNLVFIDALFRHLQWTGDLEFAKKAWPVIQRHLAWERRLFRREFGPEKLPLYEAYAAIWASDDLQYSGGGAMHASAYNYYENRQAARLARLIGEDPTPYDREADLLARGMRQLLWVGGGAKDRKATDLATAGLSPALQSACFGWFAEYKDLLGLQRVHPDAALWTYYHTVDSEVPTPEEAWQMTQYVDAAIPHIPVRGAGVPDGLCTLATSDWMPYDWSINNVVMAEAVHGALALWEAGRPDEAWSVLKGSLVAAMYMGISPGNVGSMSYLDVYRRESQRDFADGSGVLSRAMVEGLFGVKPDALAGELKIEPGWPGNWKRARIRHPDFSLEYVYSGISDRYLIEQHRTALSDPGDAQPTLVTLPLKLRLRLAARRDRIADVVVNGTPTQWRIVEDSVAVPRIEITAPAANRYDVTVRWAGAPIQASKGSSDHFVRVKQGRMEWLQPPSAKSAVVPEMLTGLTPVAVNAPRFEPIDLTSVFNDRVTQIFRNEYRAPRSPYVSLAQPKQGIGGWAGGVNKTALVDDTGLRAAAEAGGGEIVLPNGVPLATPGEPGAKNIVFTSQWDNYPRDSSVALTGAARGIYLLLAGSTDPMQSRFENGEIVVTYTDGTTTTLSLANPINWWPIDQDYFIDDFQFRRPEPLPMRVDLKTGRVRVLELQEFKGQGRTVPGGAATVLSIALDPTKSLRSLAVRATANDVVIGLMAATLLR